MEIINNDTVITLDKPINKKTALTTEEKALKKKENNRRYALNYYRKRVDSDPEYAKVLNERSKRNSNIRKGHDPDHPPSAGRPRISIN
jgi:hypothetical protein